MASPITSSLGKNGILVDATVVTLSGINFEQYGRSQQEIQPVLDQVNFQLITYLSDGLKVKGYLVSPKKGENLPCVIFNRGGNREFGKLDDSRVAHYLGTVASWGYIVIASQYRGNAGSEGKEEFGGRDVNDVLNLIPLLDSLPQADTTRIGMYGWSRGGMMTYLTLTQTDRIAAAIIGAGASDLLELAKRRPEMETEVYAQLIPNYHQNKEQELSIRSAIYWPEKLHKQTPLLLLHGSSDWRVHPNETLKMASLLYNHKHPFRLIILEGGDHGLNEHRMEIDRLTKEWFNHYLRDRKPWPSLEPHGQ